MKRVVVTTGLHEADIRPPALMSEFKRLSIAGAAEFFSDPATLVEVDCPACGNALRELVFRKHGFIYNRCTGCGSVYVSPRPTDAALAHYYANAPASRFRVEHFTRDTASARRIHLLRSHANWIAQVADDAGNPAARAYADMDTYSPQLFDELHGLGCFDRLYSVNPLAPLEQSPAQPVMLNALDSLGAISSFEKLEHQFSPHAYLNGIREVLAPGGLLFFTTRTISGFDLQMLWDKTPYIFVPEHLNLLSIEGIALLLQRANLNLVELSTPGQLDVELVQHALQEDPGITLPPFFQYLLDKRDTLAHEDFQHFLQKHRLSSHVRVAAKNTGVPRA